MDGLLIAISKKTPCYMQFSEVVGYTAMFVASSIFEQADFKLDIDYKHIGSR